ncbi:hypothetical protein [Marinimicrobium agarilyticum]|uniref:hypothetical protein n=1 Tax=Marinimicrobium agarilyticum TaxID=306546 RepID=UPI000486760F|nr:hypothetical protein [Marinimicrobium agarilyticum]
MHLIIALRLFSQSHARPGIEQKDRSGKPLGHLVDTHVDRLHQALKNVIGYHQERGSLPPVRVGEVLEEAQGGGYRVARKAECQLHWCLIETDRSAAFWEARPEVELVIPYERFQTFTQAIRGRVGALYLNACDEFAEQLEPNSQRPIRYPPPARQNRADGAEAALLAS